MRSVRTQCELPFRRAVGWGGCRRGAGRKPGSRRPVPHRRREGIIARVPGHVAVKMRATGESADRPGVFRALVRRLAVDAGIRCSERLDPGGSPSDMVADEGVEAPWADRPRRGPGLEGTNRARLATKSPTYARLPWFLSTSPARSAPGTGTLLTRHGERLSPPATSPPSRARSSAPPR